MKHPFTEEEGEKFEKAVLELTDLLFKKGLKNSFSYNRMTEIRMANELGHTVAMTYSGADAFDENKKPVEYKSTTQKNINATYNGIGVAETWEEQDEIIKEKILKYDDHFYARYDERSVLQEMWKLKGEDVYNIVIDRLKKSFESMKRSKVPKKDPRLGVSISMRDIHKYGERIR